MRWKNIHPVRLGRYAGCMLIDCPNSIIRVYLQVSRTGLLNPEPDQRHKRRLCIILPHMASHGTFMGGGGGRNGDGSGTCRHHLTPTQPGRGGWKFEPQRPRAPLDGPTLVGTYTRLGFFVHLISPPSHGGLASLASPARLESPRLRGVFLAPLGLAVLKMRLS